MNTKLIERLYILCDTESLTEVARQTGVPYNTLKNYSAASGKRMPSAEILIQIAKAKDANLNWLLLGEGNPTREMIDSKIDNGATNGALKDETVDIVIPSFSIQLRFDKSPLGKSDEMEHIPLYNSASP